MTVKPYKLILSFAAILSLASCAKEGPAGPTGVAGPNQTGTISGHVKLYDKYGSAVLTGLSNVQLFLNNGATAIKPDSTGFYQFSTIGTVLLATGVYTITATDIPYASTIKNNIQLIGGNLNVDLKLSAIPDSFLYTFKAYHDTASVNDSLVLTFRPYTRFRSCILFANKSASVGNAPANYLWSKVLSIPPTISQLSLLVPAQDLTDIGLPSSAKIYFAAYSYVVNDGSVYEDFGTGKMVYNAVSGGLVDSTIVP
jgi:hypothetical protein